MFDASHLLLMVTSRPRSISTANATKSGSLAWLARLDVGLEEVMSFVWLSRLLMAKLAFCY